MAAMNVGRSRIQHSAVHKDWTIYLVCALNDKHVGIYPVAFGRRIDVALNWPPSPASALHAHDGHVGIILTYTDRRVERSRATATGSEIPWNAN